MICHSGTSAAHPMEKTSGKGNGVEKKPQKYTSSEGVGFSFPSQCIPLHVGWVSDASPSHPQQRWQIWGHVQENQGLQALPQLEALLQPEGLGVAKGWITPKAST